jgi:hypothetical protein
MLGVAAKVFSIGGVSLFEVVVNWIKISPSSL